MEKLNIVSRSLLEFSQYLTCSPDVQPRQGGRGALVRVCIMCLILLFLRWVVGSMMDVRK